MCSFTYFDVVRSAEAGQAVRSAGRGRLSDEPRCDSAISVRQLGCCARMRSVQRAPEDRAGTVLLALIVYTYTCVLLHTKPTRTYTECN